MGGYILSVVVVVGATILGALFYHPSATPVTAPPAPGVEKIENVVRVLMHEPERYTLLGEKGESHELWQRTFFAHTTLYVDVPSGEKMWARAEGVNCDFFRACGRLEIHIHTPQDVNGAGWVHSSKKSTQHGQTVVIE